MFGDGGSRVAAANLSDAEDGFPTMKLPFGRGRIAESGVDESTFGPSIGDVCEMPFDPVWRRPSIELITYVDQNLNRRDVDVID